MPQWCCCSRRNRVEEEGDAPASGDGGTKVSVVPAMTLARSTAVATAVSTFRPQRRNSFSEEVLKPGKRTWLQSQVGRPTRLILIRHGESQGNVDRSLTQRVPDPDLHLTIRGRRQALEAGKRLKDIIGEESLRFIISPYVRARETFHAIAQSFGGVDEQSVIEDPRIREMEFGNYDRSDIKRLQKERSNFGAFFYRFPEGESPADVYDRASAFLESLYRMWQLKEEDNYVIVAHGTLLLVLFQRFFGLTVDEFYALEAMNNCEFLVIQRNEKNIYKLNDVYSMRDGLPRCDGPRRQEYMGMCESWDGTEETLEDTRLLDDAIRKSSTC